MQPGIFLGHCSTTSCSTVTQNVYCLGIIALPDRLVQIYTNAKAVARTRSRHVDRWGCGFGVARIILSQYGSRACFRCTYGGKRCRILTNQTLLRPWAGHDTIPGSKLGWCIGARDQTIVYAMLSPAGMLQTTMTVRHAVPCL